LYLCSGVDDDVSTLIVESIQNFLTVHAHLAPPEPPSPTPDPTSTLTSHTTPPKTSQAYPIEISLPLVLSAREDLLGLPSQIEAIRGLVERGVDGSGGLNAYFDTGSGSGDGDAGGMRGSENQGIGNEGRLGQAGVEAGGRNYDVTSRLNAVETALYGRLAGRHMDDGSNPVDLGTSSVVNVSSATTTTSTTPTMMDAGQGEAGGVSRGRGENLRRVGEVLGRWDNFVSVSSRCRSHPSDPLRLPDTIRRSRTRPRFSSTCTRR